MRLVLAVAVLLAVPAAAQALVPCTSACPARLYWESQPLTRPTPTTAPSVGTVGSGMSLTGVYGARVTLCPTAGQTLTGAGTLRAYYWHSSVATWMRNPDLDLSVGSATTTANPCRVWPDWTTSVRGGGFILSASDGIGVSGGSAVVVRVDGQVTP